MPRFKFFLVPRQILTTSHDVLLIVHNCSQESEFLPEGVVLLVSPLCAVLGGQSDSNEAQHGACEDHPDQAPEDGVLSEQWLLQTGGLFCSAYQKRN